MSKPRKPEKARQESIKPETGGEPVGLSEIGSESAADAGGDEKIAIPLPVEENDSNAQTI